MSHLIIDHGGGFIVRHWMGKSTYIGAEQEACNQKFSEQFVKIFKAAARGDLAACEAVVGEGFYEFKTYSLGRLTEQNGKSLDYVSIEQIAEKNECTQITKYFQKVLKNFRVNQSVFDSEAIFEEKTSKNIRDCRRLVESSTDLVVEQFINATDQLASDKNLRKLIDNITDFSSSVNLLDYILTYGEKNPEKTIHKLAEKCPVKVDHLMYAIQQRCSSGTLRILLNKAIQGNRNLDTKHCIHWLFEAKLPHELMIQFLSHSSEFDYQSLYYALKLPLPANAIESIVAKLIKRHDPIWVSRCRSIILKEKAPERRGLEFFKNLPKPYLPNLTPIPSSLFKKIVENCFDFFSSDFRWTELLGKVEDEMLWEALERGVRVTPADFELVLLYGYSEELVLHLCKCFNSKTLDSRIIEIAKMRNYSPELQSQLQVKCSAV